MSQIKAVFIHVTGIVQGVGFRPFVYSLANEFNLTGWVRNTSAGVEISIEGSQKNIDLFLSAFPQKLPPLAKIDSFSVVSKSTEFHKHFEILESSVIEGAFQPISPDISTCPDCLRELTDPGDRRYRYPFINCTNCGPRFTIISDIPYDRPNTTMSAFPMCPDCEVEYTDPSNRRFHAQPIACPVCGPHIWFETSQRISFQQVIKNDDALLATMKAVYDRKIVAIKGLGGFHLACDAGSQQAVDLLRQRKMRVDKPFAVMLPSLEAIEKACFLSDSERALLLSKERPIVILKRRPECDWIADVSPRQSTIGVMLPYTPLHFLLFVLHPNANFSPPQALVMTSGNLSEEPIAVSNEEARDSLSMLADAFLFHDRSIHIRCDDSVFRAPETEGVRSFPVRRSRGYTPIPLMLPWKSPPILGLGAELKNTFCLSNGQYAFPSHHIGDMQNFETLTSFLEGIDHFQKLFHITPQYIACDYHPDYLSTRVAMEKQEKQGIPVVQVQHHHAHIAACMVENGLQSDHQVIGVALDGTGYGFDSAIWGGELFYGTYSGFIRAYHLEYMPLPGGDFAIRNPSRIALAYLWHCQQAWDDDLPPVNVICADDRMLLHSLLTHKINTPMTSSMGRLFDAVSSLIGVCHQSNYEGQAAVELEAIADFDVQDYYPIDVQSGFEEINITPIVCGIVEDMKQRKPLYYISGKFHNSIVVFLCSYILAMRNLTGIETVVLSGGVWQNTTLLRKIMIKLRALGFSVLSHHHVSPNDGGISLGQCAIAYHQLIGKKEGV